jgi:hypothetical protein
MTLLLNKISEAQNAKKHSIIIFCDLKKAFDTCNHRILLTKLHDLGIRNTELDWFKSYLTDRQQLVSIDSIDSTLRFITTGVPQGSILGPLLFLLYINDLPNCTLLLAILFADDTALFASSNDINELINLVNSEMLKICTYFRINKLSLHPAKTKYLLISSNQAVLNSDIELFLNNNNTDDIPKPELIHPLQRVKTNDDLPAIKYLGVYFDPNLDFKYHIDYINKKLSRALYSLRSVRNLLPEKSLLTLYYSLFHCHLIYAIEIWSCASPSLIQPLIKKQKAAIRIICNKKYNDHTEPLFKNLRILPLNDLIYFFNLKLIHSFVYKTIPIALTTTWVTNLEHRQLTNDDDGRIIQLRNDDDLFVPPSRTEFLTRHPFFNLPKLWNNAPLSIKLKSSKIQFTYALKLHLIEKLSTTNFCTRLLCPVCHLAPNLP